MCLTVSLTFAPILLSSAQFPLLLGSFSQDVLEEVKKEGEVKFCRCWRSATFPFCDVSS